MKSILINFISLIILTEILSVPICKEKENYCIQCHPVKKICTKCQYNVFTPDKTGVCEGIKKCTVGINQCLTCSDDGYLCDICEQSYFPDENGGCSFSDNCAISYNGECLKCKEDFILNKANKICKSINSEDLINCETINMSNGLCEKCEEGYFLNTGDKKCVKIQNCLESVFGVCKKCNAAYYLDMVKQTCIKQSGKFKNCQLSTDSSHCELCDDNYYFDNNDNCIEIKFCAKAGNNSDCEECLDGYYLSENKKSCTTEQNCYSGDKELGVCTLCKDGYYIDFKDGKCKSNTKNNDLKYCQVAEGKCKECIYGYYLSEDEECCSSKYCVEADNGTCLACTDNYYLGLDGKCVNVEHCKYSTFDECVECVDNYYYDKKSKKCRLAEGNLANCKTGYENMFCDDCKNDYYLNKTDNLCYKNDKKGPFYKCSVTSYNAEYCIKCSDKYYLGSKDDLCTLIEGCELSSTEKKCLQCDRFHCLNVKTGNCENNYQLKSEETKFYYKCNRTNEEGTACESCINGFELNNKGLCVDYTQCADKKDGVCQKCNSVEGGESYCLNPIFGCVKTYVDSHCLECNDILDFHKCSKCMDGYIFDEVKNLCVKKK